MVNHGKPLLIPSKSHEDWRKDALLQLTQVKEKITRKATVTITFYPKTKAKGDLTNKAESVMDALVDAGIIKDDNWFVVDEVNLHFGEVDKTNPRAEIYICQDSE